MAQYELTNGMKVMSNDGKSLGKIIRIEPGFFVVEKGFFFQKDYEVPASLVADVRDGACWLSIDQDALERERDRAMAHDTGREAGAEGRIPAAGTAGEAGQQGEQRLTLSEEELEARKRVHDAGEVAIRKEVTTEHRQIDVPVMKEEVHVERRAASEASSPSGEPFREETIKVPVREEEVEVTKRPRVREEVRVAKRASQEERRVEGDVRREEARVERTGDVGPEHGIKEDEEP